MGTENIHPIKGTNGYWVVGNDSAHLCYPFDELARRRNTALTALQGLSVEQLSAANRLFIWMSNSNHPDHEVTKRMQLVFKGDTKFAALILDALLAVKAGPAPPAND